jgi:hypothetical protein
MPPLGAFNEGMHFGHRADLHLKMVDRAALFRILCIHTVEGGTMAKKAQPPPASPKPYEVLAMRLQRAINTPAAQKSKSALLERLPGDREEDWTQILEEIGETDNVTMAYRDDGNVQLFWTVAQED